MSGHHYDTGHHTNFGAVQKHDPQILRERPKTQSAKLAKEKKLKTKTKKAKMAPVLCSSISDKKTLIGLGWTITR